MNLETEGKQFVAWCGGANSSVGSYGAVIDWAKSQLNRNSKNTDKVYIGEVIAVVTRVDPPIEVRPIKIDHISPAQPQLSNGNGHDDGPYYEGDFPKHL